MLGVALVVVFRPFSSAFSAVVDNDVAAATAGSGHETRACEACRGAIARPCRVWRRFREILGSFEAGAAAMVAVVNVVDVVDEHGHVTTRSWVTTHPTPVVEIEVTQKGGGLR